MTITDKEFTVRPSFNAHQLNPTRSFATADWSEWFGRGGQGIPAGRSNGRSAHTETDQEKKAALKTAILGYNRDDVIATRRLEEWLCLEFTSAH